MACIPTHLELCISLRRRIPQIWGIQSPETSEILFVDYHFICRHRIDGLYDFVLFVLHSKQEIPKRAVQHRKFWCFNVPVVYINLLFLLLFGTFWYTLGTSRTPDQKFAEVEILKNLTLRLALLFILIYLLA